MDKDTILKLSREENEGHDEMERSALISSNNAAYLVGGFICVVILLLHLIFGKQPNFSVYAVFFSMSATANLMTYRKTKRTVSLILFVMNAAVFIIFFVLYIRSLFR